MAPQQQQQPRKNSNKGLPRGTFLLVDGEKFDVSNIVHESTEQIPSEVTVILRKCTWEEHLYPSLEQLELCGSSRSTATRNQAETTAFVSTLSSSNATAAPPHERRGEQRTMARRRQGANDYYFESQHHHHDNNVYESTDDRETDDDDEEDSSAVTSSSSALSSSSASSGSSSSPPPSSTSFGRYAVVAGNASWNHANAQHDSLASINWTPQLVLEEKAEILKQFAQSGGPAQVPGAVHVTTVGTKDDEVDAIHESAAAARMTTALTKKDISYRSITTTTSTPGAVHVDGNGIDYQHSLSSFRLSERCKTSTSLLLDDSKPSSEQMPSLYTNVDGVEHPSSLYVHDVTEQQPECNNPLVFKNHQSWCDDNGVQHFHESDDDYHHQSWSSHQLQAAAAAFGRDCAISSQRSFTTPSRPQQQQPQRMVQVTHDLELPLHGANETTHALETGNVVTVVCVVCRATLRCIAIAQYVLCPECKCLTPLEDDNDNDGNATGRGRGGGGVGLGLLSTYDQSYRVGVS